MVCSSVDPTYCGWNAYSRIESILPRCCMFEAKNLARFFPLPPFQEMPRYENHIETDHAHENRPSQSISQLLTTLHYLEYLKARIIQHNFPLSLIWIFWQPMRTNKKSPDQENLIRALEKFRQRPTLPPRRRGSTIGARELGDVHEIIRINCETTNM